MGMRLIAPKFHARLSVPPILLAIRRRLPLATLDEPLKSAAAAVGVTLYDPTGKRP